MIVKSTTDKHRMIGPSSMSRIPCNIIVKSGNSFLHPLLDGGTATNFEYQAGFFELFPTVRSLSNLFYVTATSTIPPDNKVSLGLLIYHHIFLLSLNTFRDLYNPFL